VSGNEDEVLKKANFFDRSNEFYEDDYFSLTEKRRNTNLKAVRGKNYISNKRLRRLEKEVKIKLKNEFIKLHSKGDTLELFEYDYSVDALFELNKDSLTTAA
jgi:hypothetical protein